ncbi:hypothetical protein GH714_016764 [Hevea brasiliensis]|uniref:DUF4219 domain-containing protein n=1 Tax=Hevea brasiliensis TaxID=3981 RepID=A0A6A6NHX7_HEVBR|nr:hypothetical protein GH714_016764 [Hevea brasiliensis]
MASSNNSLGNGPPMFNGENYHIWEIKMKSYLKALNLWDAIENGADPPPLGPNPTLNQIKNFEEASTRSLELQQNKANQQQLAQDQFLDPTVIKVDNQSAILIAKNPVQHGRTKHIQVKYHAIRQAEKDGEISLVHCSSNDQLADILTKSLGKAKFEELREKIGVIKKTY